jgi:type V secretory pathway adhesin AidA
MNVIDFNGKKVLIRPSTADKDKDKEVIIGNAREADGNNKISCRKVVAEKTPDGGETLKVTITTSGTGGQAQTRGYAREPILHITDGPVPRHRWSVTSLDGPERSSGRSDNAKEPRRPRTFKPRRPEIGTWKTNTFKAAGRLIKSSPTFDQLLSKYVKKKAGPSDRAPKRPCLPTQERQQVRPIGPPHQSEKTRDHNVQLRPNVPAWTPTPPHTPMSYHYTYIPPLPYIPNQMWGRHHIQSGYQNTPPRGHLNHLFLTC